MPDSTFDKAGVLEQSLVHHRSGDLDGAREGYLEVLLKEPNNPVALNLLGTLDAQLGNLDDAERLIRRAISFAPKEGVYYTNLAGVLQQQERFQEAIQTYHLALKLEPDQPEVLNNFGALLLQAGRPQEAEEHFRKVLESRPDSPEAHNNLGRALNNQRKYEEALVAFEDAVRLDPEFAAAHNNLGHVNRALGRNTTAAARFQEAIRLDEDLADAYQNLGTIYLAQNMPEEAVECFEEAARREPEKASIFIDLGVALHGLGKLGEAVNAYRKAVERDENNPYAFMNLGIVLYERRNLKAAETALARALVLKPDLIDAAAELAGLLDEMGRLDDMEKVIEKGLQANPRHARLNLEAAKLDRRQGRVPQAIKRLTQFDLKAVDQRLAQELRYELGRLYDRAGESDLAWLHAGEANKLAAAGWRAFKVDTERLPKRLRALQAFCADTDLTKLPRAPAADTAAPVFLVGFPASGSDFVSEALHMHAGLQTLDEAPTLSAVEQALSAMPEGYPAAIANLDIDAIAYQRDEYWRIVNRLLKRKPGSLLVDHHPMRAVHAALAWRLFPEAKFIYVQRHPADLCVASFMQNYAMNDTNAHFLAMDTTVTILELAWHTWQAAVRALDLDVHVVRFERLAQNPGAEIAGVCEFLDLEPDDASMGFVDDTVSGKRITRSSFRQLADPLDAHMHERWPDYRLQLSRFMDRLMPLAREMGYEFD
ncbi:MAG: tetratricopeptide repeat protein [Gammaproteobacteria bacterium]|nr:tetratricopeptide repeat protein [Gammaproteobacteria bacterium]